MGLIWTIGHLMAAAAGGGGAALRWLGGFTITREGEPQSNDFHRSSADLSGSSEDFSHSIASTIGIADAWTWMIWLKPNTFTTGKWLAQIWNGSGLANNIRLRTGAATATDLHFDFHNSSGTSIHDTTVSSFFTNAEWNCLVITWDGDALTIYNNAVQKHQTTGLSGAQTDTSRLLSVGGNQVGNNTSPMFLHSSALWNAALTADEVRTIFNHGAGTSINLAFDQGNYSSSANLKHWYRFMHDCTSNATLGSDYSGSLDLDKTNGVTRADLAQDSPDGAMVDYSGTSEYHLNNTPQAYSIGASYTISTWVRLQSLVANKRICDFGDNTTANKNRTGLFINGSSVFQFFAADSASASGAANGAVSPQVFTWYHVVGVKDGTTSMKLYVNGEEVGSDTTSIPTTTDANRIGAIGSGAKSPTVEEMTGDVHSVALWSSALSAAEVVSLYNGGFKDFDLAQDADNYVSSANVVHWWKVGDPAQTGESGDDTIRDAVSSGGIDLSANSAGVTSADVFVRRGAAQGVASNLSGTSEYYLNTTANAIGITNAWSILLYGRLANVTAQKQLFDIAASGSDVNRIGIETRGDIAGDPTRVFFADSAGTVVKDYRWNGLLPNATWASFLVTWDGTNLTMYQDGATVTADTKSTDGSGTMTATNRRVGIGTNAKLGGGSDWAGYVGGFVAVWSSALPLAEACQVLSLGHSADLLTDSLGYSSSADLVHWWKLGSDPSNLGRDFVSSGGIDVDVNSSGITHEADVVGFMREL